MSAFIAILALCAIPLDVDLFATSPARDAIRVQKPCGNGGDAAAATAAALLVVLWRQLKWERKAQVLYEISISYYEKCRALVSSQ